MSVHTIDWGDVPTWVSAVTTMLALGAAGWVVAIELRRDRRALQARESAEQADLVAAWPFEDVQKFRNLIRVRNGSPLPIYDVKVYIAPTHGKIVALEMVEVVPPGDLDLAYRLPSTHGEPPSRGPEGPPQEVNAVWGIEIRFRDSAGRRWQRDVQGRLIRQDPPR